MEVNNLHSTKTPFSSFIFEILNKIFLDLLQLADALKNFAFKF